MEGPVPSQSSPPSNLRDTPRPARRRRRLSHPLIALLCATLLVAACSDEVTVPKEQITDQPTADSTPVPVPGDLPSLVLGPEAPFPDGVALLLKTGCFQCDGPATGLIRVSRDAAGGFGRGLLVSAGVHFLNSVAEAKPGDGTSPALYFAGDIEIPRETIQTSKGPQPYDPYVTGIAVSGDGTETIVSVCVYPGCGIGMDAWSPQGRANLYRSVDGGATWAEYGSMEGGGVIGMIEPGRVLAYRYADGLEAFSMPGQQGIERPDVETGGVAYPPFVLANGVVVWPNRSGDLQRPDGTEILAVPELPGVTCPCYIAWAVQQSFGDGLIAVHWSADEPGSAAYITLFTPDGAEVETYSTGGRFLLAGAWISDGVLAANVGVEASELDAQAPQFFPSLLPALIDFDAHTINPITDPFLLPGMEAGRNLVRGIQRLE